MAFVYVFEFPNGKRYVGGTRQNPKVRWQYGRNYIGKVREAIDHFGWRYVTKLACWVPDNELDEQERYYIEKYKTTDPEFGYNSESGGKKGFNHSEESCRKISGSKKGTKPSDETRRKMSESRKLWWARKKGLI